MNPVAQYTKENYSRDTILDVPWNTVISFPLSRKTMYGLVSTCFSLGILSSCPVCEKWWHLQPLQGNCPGWFPQWSPCPSGDHLAGHLLSHWEGFGCSNMPTEKTLHSALWGEEDTLHFYQVNSESNTGRVGGLSLVAVILHGLQV